MLILIDSREKIPFDIQFYGLKAKVVPLRTGDYSLEGMESFVSIDRKASVSELVNNLFFQWKRFKKEMERASLIENFYIIVEQPFYLVEVFPIGSGIPKRKWPYIHATPELICNRLKGIYENYGVKTVFCDSRSEAEELTVKILEYAITGKTVEVDYYA